MNQKYLQILRANNEAGDGNMTNMIQKVLHSIYQIARTLHLTKMRVIYQIVLIIAIMGIFMGALGYIGITAMSNLQNTTQIVYDETANKLHDLSQLKVDVDDIALTYLEVVSSGGKSDSKGKTADNQEESLGLTYSGVQELIDKAKAKTSYLDGFDESTRQRIKNQLETISKEVQSNPGIQGYPQIKQNIISIKTDIDTAYSICFNAALNVISKNQSYGATSQKISIVIVAFSVLLSLMIGFVIVIAISNPLKTMETATRSLAMGDLSRNVTAEGSPEVMNTILEFNKAIAGLRELVIRINRESDVLLSSSNELKGATHETRQSAQQVAIAMEDLAKASSEQASQITQAVDTIQLLSDLVTKVSDQTTHIALTSEQVAETAIMGQKATTDVSNEINELYNSTREVAKVIDGLNETSGEINEITAVIRGIAEQTTLLALNASIEAARAGEHGKGFAVVAGETGKLADQSKQAAEHISDLITQMRLRTEKAVQVITASNERAELSKKLSSEASITFGKIFDSLKATLGEIEAVAKSAHQMAESNKAVTDAITTIAAISEESMASTEEVSATTEEQSASVEQLSVLADGLAQIANDLKQSVAAFNLGIKS